MARRARSNRASARARFAQRSQESGSTRSGSCRASSRGIGAGSRNRLFFLFALALPPVVYFGDRGAQSQPGQRRRRRQLGAAVPHGRARVVRHDDGDGLSLRENWGRRSGSASPPTGPDHTGSCTTSASSWRLLAGAQRAHRAERPAVGHDGWAVVIVWTFVLSALAAWHSCATPGVSRSIQP
jgi:hypothetical protein